MTFLIACLMTHAVVCTQLVYLRRTQEPCCFTATRLICCRQMPIEVQESFTCMESNLLSIFIFIHLKSHIRTFPTAAVDMNGSQ